MAPSIWRMWISSADNPNSVRTAVVPWTCATKEDGTPFYAPDIKEAHSGTVEYWKRRSLESKYPILRALCTICFPNLNKNYIDTGTRCPEYRRHKGRDLTLADKMGMANDPSEVVLRQDSANPESPPRNNVTGGCACYSFETHFEFWRGTTAPKLSQDTDRWLGQLGHRREEIAELRSKGVI
jgi:hypothetical protein